MKTTRKQPTRRPLSRRARILIVALALLLVAALGIGAYLLFSDRSDLNTIVADTTELYRDTKTGATYRILPASYEPIARGEEYGELDMNGVDYILHRVAGLEATEWLCSVYGDVYCAEELDPATFDAWNINALHVCTNTNLVTDALLIKPDAAHPRELCDELFALLQDTYKSGTPVYYPSYATAEEVYTLRFESEDAPGLYFSIKLIKYTEDIYEGETNLGRTFLYDRYAGRCVAVSDIIFRMLDGKTLAEAMDEVRGNG